MSATGGNGGGSALHVSDGIVRQIVEAIEHGELAPGDRLPSQRELQRRFSVSGTAVLSAVRVLESRGLIEVRRGAHGGAFVRPFSPASLGAALEATIDLHSVSLHELMELRDLIETAQAERAARTPTTAFIARLEAEVDALAAVDADPHGTWAEFGATEARCHAALASASPNRLLVAVQTALCAAVGRRFGVVPPDVQRGFLKDWFAIRDAIRAGDADGARDAMHRHVLASIAAAGGDETPAS